jgi:hypothetical protein
LLRQWDVETLSFIETPYIAREQLVPDDSGESSLFDRTLELAADYDASRRKRQQVGAVDRYWAPLFPDGGPQVWHNAPLNLGDMLAAVDAGTSLPPVETPLAPVMNQRVCGSCFVVSSLSAMQMHMSLAAQRTGSNLEGDAVTVDYSDGLRCLQNVRLQAEEGYDVFGVGSVDFSLSFDESAAAEMGREVPFAKSELRKVLYRAIATDAVARATAAGQTPPSVDDVIDEIGAGLWDHKGGEFGIGFYMTTLGHLTDFVGVPVTLDTVADVLRNLPTVTLPFVDPRPSSTADATTEDVDPIKVAAARALAETCSTSSGGGSSSVPDARLYGSNIQPVNGELTLRVRVDDEISVPDVCGGGYGSLVLHELWASTDPSLEDARFRIRPDRSVGPRTTSFVGTTNTPDGWSPPYISDACGGRDDDYTDTFRLYRLGFGNDYSSSFASAQPYEDVPIVKRGRPINMSDPVEVETVRIEGQAVMRYLDAGPLLASIKACDHYSLPPREAIDHNNPFPTTTSEACACSFTFTTNHAIVVVGYYYDEEVLDNSYWIIQNSYSETWGFGGFVFVRWGHMGLSNFRAPLLRHISETVNPALPPLRADAVRLRLFAPQTPAMADAAAVDTFLRSETEVADRESLTDGSNSSGIPPHVVVEAGTTVGIHFTSSNPRCSPRTCLEPLPPLLFTDLVVQLAAPAVGDAPIGGTVNRADLASSTVVLAGIAMDDGTLLPTPETPTVSVAAGSAWTRSVDTNSGESYDTISVRIALSAVGAEGYPGSEWARLALGASADSQPLRIVKAHLAYDEGALDASAYYRSSVGDDEAGSPAWLWPVVGGVAGLCCCGILVFAVLATLGLAKRRSARANKHSLATTSSPAAAPAFGSAGAVGAYPNSHH